MPPKPPPRIITRRSGSPPKPPLFLPHIGVPSFRAPRVVSTSIAYRQDTETAAFGSESVSQGRRMCSGHVLADRPLGVVGMRRAQTAHLLFQIPDALLSFDCAPLRIERRLLGLAEAPPRRARMRDQVAVAVAH